ncbi:phosphomannomutase [Haloactinopolyspora alba]|uniref:Phosphomannomutase n=1 Tax=Haloactinopolyspora alba TaxID=648780 RepID=A0A2P8D3E9_9ACTN|nr:phosphomannomutase/phosphoglucomutase [Haloactinopolyspora alba]PSK91706.1 phosphomannomutase [Haloactinopolyspora alba]
MHDLDAIVKAYDIRGVVPDQLDDATAAALGVAAAEVLAHGSGAMVVGHDMRASSPSLADAFAAGVTAAGVDVVNAGLTSTDQLYYASGALDLPGAMFTASHNPARYNGIKLCRAGAAPVGQETGLGEIKASAEKSLAEGGPSRPASLPNARPGTVEHRDTLGDYAAHLHGLVDLTGIRPLTVVVDAGNGMAGHTVPAVLGTGGVTVVPLYFELDGTFPNHEANPIDPATLVDLQATVRERGADLGLAFDGDADRCFVVDERGAVVTPSALTALIAVRELARVPGSAIVHNLITSRAVPEIVTEHGGTPVRTRVGHSLIKQTMAETGAVFGGEHSGHFYFRDFWRADSGMLAALHTLAALGADPQRRPLSQLLQPYARYAASGEINSTVDDAGAATARVEESFGAGPGVSCDRLDGLTVEHAAAPMWWFNLRPSNTEPLLRLNVEAADEATMARVRDDVLATIRDRRKGHP